MKLSTTRTAIHDALAWGYLQKGESGIVQYLTYLTKIEKSIGRGDPSGDFLEAAYICAAINTLPGHLCGWLKFAYGPDEDNSLIQAALAAKLRNLFPICSVKKHVKLLALSSTGLEDYRLRLRRNRDLPDIVYCESMSVPQPNFYRDGYGDKRDTVLGEIKLWDGSGVGQISRMVRALNGDEGSISPSEVLEDIGNDK